MKKHRQFVNILMVWALLFGNSLQIYVPNEQNQKPSTYSAGIKTAAHQKPAIQLHHNYSKVYHQNYNVSARNVTDNEEPYERPFPVYNAHTYGSRPSSSPQVFVVNGTRIRKNENPTRQIVLYNKRKRTPQIEIYGSCPDRSTGQFVYEFSCNQFLDCWHGRGQVQNCPPGTLFNPQTLQCDWPEKVQCISGPKQNILQKSARTFEQVHCPKEFSGLIPNYGDCSKFINCVNGIEYFMDCPPGTLFDVNRNICDFSDKVACFSVADSGPRNQQKSQALHQAPQQSFSQYQDQIVCPEGAVGLHKHPLDCSKFLNCANGQTYIQDCAPGTLFNPIMKICDFPYNVQCHIDVSQFQRAPNNVGSSTYSGQAPLNSKQPTYNRPITQGSGPNMLDWESQASNVAPQCCQTGAGSRGPTGSTYGGQLPYYPNQPLSNTQLNQGTIPNRFQPTLSHYGPFQQGFIGVQPSYNPHQPTQFYPGLRTNDFGSTQGCCRQHIPTQPLTQVGFVGVGGGQPGGIQDCCKHSRNNPSQPTYTTQISQDGGANQFIRTGSPGDARDCCQGQLNPVESTDFTGSPRPNEMQQLSGTEEAVTGPTPTCCDRQNVNQFTHHGNNIYRDSNHPESNVNQQGRGSEVSNSGWIQQNHYLKQETTTPNYQQVVNINQFKSTRRIPLRPTYESFYGSTSPSHVESHDYEDTIGTAHSQKYIRATTPRIHEKSWPPPFPSTDVNADYVFDDDHNTIELEAENSNHNNRKISGCTKSDFSCSPEECISRTAVCNGRTDCPNGADEANCLEYLSKFSWTKDSKLAVLEQERWDNITVATCAQLCLEASKFLCRSFNYRKIDKTCFLTSANQGATGAIIAYYPFDYYELGTETLNCTNMYICQNKKCIRQEQICDGHDDCGDRMDEKGCKPEDFNYSVKLSGSKRTSEGRVEITAFGKTGYLCDDNFGLRDAHVVCKEVGFELGALEVKGNSFYPTSEEKKPFYMMDDVTCMGNETRLMDCDFSGWGVHNCLGEEIAGVVCKTPQEKCPKEYWQCDTGQECLPLPFVCDGLLDCADGSDEGSQHCDAPTEIRLANGSKPNEGRIEIKHNGIWGTICDDDFNEDAAKVICHHFGYKGSAIVKKDSYFGSGDGPIWLDQVSCEGNETHLESCTHWDWGEHNCEHSEDVGVICSTMYQQERHSSVPVKTVSGVYPTQCGYRRDNIFNLDDDVHFRVVKAAVARKGDYPWQAAIRVKGKTKAAHWCGAVIISDKFVLTAAHCLTGYPKGAYIVVTGDYDIDEDEGTEQEAYIDDYRIHENFRKGHKMNNDIALVKLKGHGFRLNQDVQAICLPDTDAIYEKDLNCTISGFGSIESGKSAFSHKLRAGWIPVQSREVCTMPHIYGDALTEGMICAGSLDEGIDSCDGDSGGPLACLSNGVFTLYGITSWGQHCGYANKPGVYVNVGYYRNWIDENFYKYHTTEV